MVGPLLRRLHNLKICMCLQQKYKYSGFKNKTYVKSTSLTNGNQHDELIKKYAPKLIYNSIIEKAVLKYERQQKRKERSCKDIELNNPLPVSLKYLSDEVTVQMEASDNEKDALDENLINFPYNRAYNINATIESEYEKQITDGSVVDLASEADREVRERQKLQKEMKNWMVAYDNYDDSCLVDDQDEVDEWKINYGTPDPKSRISNIPCGGCGSLLHCRDPAIPGYIPSEIFKNSVAKGGANLEAIVCQRCHFLKYYNCALQVQVNPEDYPKVLATINKRQGLVILMVDLLDFPCSIWPGIGEFFGHKTPVVVVGNKVDLIPQDSAEFLQHIKTTVLNNVKLQGFATFNIKDVVLISAKTGFGIEELITRLNNLYWFKGDVYIVGSTNVGKSSLFNAFLQSDYCKIQAVDLIQRATTSVWPGTTLSLLKFPIRRPVGHRQYLRHKRLENLQKIEAEEALLRKEQLKQTKDSKYATLMGHIEMTKKPNPKADESRDSFSVQGHADSSGKLKMGINEKSAEFALSKWCYDTPGVIQSDQIIHLLTAEELLLVLPKELILPRSFCLKPQSSLFIAGLARLDYVEGPGSVRLTVFSSNELPITVCNLDRSDEIYQELLGSDLLKVPTGSQDRIARWPKLEMAQDVTVVGENWYKSSSDVVLSSAGWVAVTGRKGLEYKFHIWTPQKRGVYLRECLLPYAVALSGPRIKHSVAYNKFKFFLK